MIKHIIITVVHKWLVLIAGLKKGVPIWQLIIHDLSKFRPDELISYSRYFHGEQTPEVIYEFTLACQRHYARNPHHWQHWVKDGRAQYIPSEYLDEMLADWEATAKQLSKPDVRGWFGKQEMNIHPVTRHTIERGFGE